MLDAGCVECAGTADNELERASQTLKRSQDEIWIFVTFVLFAAITRLER